jgi:hypothetical protein
MSFGRYILLSLPLAALALSSCAFKKDSEKEQEKVIPVVVEGTGGDQLTERDFSFTHIAQEELNSYVVRVSWPANKRVNVAYRTAVRKTRVLEGENSFDITCRGGQQITFVVSFQPRGTESEIEEELTKTYTCPLDLEVRQPVIFTTENVKHYGRVVFRRNGTLDLNGKSWTATIESLIAEDNATLYSNASGQFLRTDPSIRQRIDLDIKQGQGLLNIILQGSMGHDGLNGDDVRSEEMNKNPSLKAFFLKSRDGAKGESAQFIKNCFSDGRAGDRQRCETECIKMSGNGGPGEDGVAGFAGADGENGGPTPKLKIHVGATKTEKPMTFNVVHILGIGGKGGRGGTPIPPGKGGAPGDGPIACNHASPGPNGKSAAPGKDGNNGDCGEATPSEISGAALAFENKQSIQCRTD